MQQVRTDYWRELLENQSLDNTHAAAELLEQEEAQQKQNKKPKKKRPKAKKKSSRVAKVVVLDVYLESIHPY